MARPQIFLSALIGFVSIVGVTIGPGMGQDDSWSRFQNGGKLGDSSWTVASEWSPSDGFAWVADLVGYGQSTPVAFNDRIYLTSVEGDNKERLFVQAIDAGTGKLAWVHELANSSPEKNTPMVSRAAATPAVDPAGVIAFFEGGNLIALDHAGHVRWKRDLKADFGSVEARHGLAGSLEQDSKHVFVWVERQESPYLLAVSKEDGSDVWKAEGLGATTWSSPRLMQVDGEPQLILSGSGKIAGYNPANGERLWEFAEVAGNTSSTPVPIGNNRFLMGSSGGREGEPSIPSCGVIEVSAVDGNYKAEWVWTAPRASCSFGSPIAWKERAYFVNRSGIVFCHDLESGELIFNARLPSSQIWATPLATGEYIYFFGKDGVTAVVEPDAELKVVAENSLWEADPNARRDAESGGGPAMGGPVLYAAAIVDSKLLLRRGDRLFAIGKNGSGN